MEKEISSIIILSTFQKNSNFSLIPLIHPKEFSRTRESIYPFTWQLEKILKPIDSFFFSFKSLVSPQSIDYYYTTRLASKRLYTGIRNGTFEESCNKARISQNYRGDEL